MVTTESVYVSVPMPVQTLCDLLIDSGFVRMSDGPTRNSFNARNVLIGIRDTPPPGSQHNDHSWFVLELYQSVGRYSKNHPLRQLFRQLSEAELHGCLIEPRYELSQYL